MQEITCQGNGLIFDISCTSHRPESLLASALPNCNMNWKGSALQCSICRRCDLKQSTHRHWMLVNAGMIRIFHGMTLLDGKRRSLWLWIYLSIWFDEQLCGLCFANPNRSRQRIRIVRLEGQPGEIHPLKKRIATLSILAIEHYAAIIGSKFIEVQEPLKGAIPIYQQHGFLFDTERRLVKAVGSLVS